MEIVGWLTVISKTDILSSLTCKTDASHEAEHVTPLLQMNGKLQSHFSNSNDNNYRNKSYVGRFWIILSVVCWKEATNVCYREVLRWLAFWCLYGGRECLLAKFQPFFLVTNKPEAAALTLQTDTHHPEEAEEFEPLTRRCRNHGSSMHGML